MKFAKIMSLLLCTTVLFCGCIKDNRAAIKINDKVITRAEFYDDFNKMKDAQFKNLSKDLQAPDSYLVLSLKNKFVNDVIFRELLAQEFEKRKIEATQKEIDAKKAEIISQMGSEENLNKILKENAITPERLQKDLASEVKTIKLLDQLNVTKVSDKDAQKYYNNNKEKFNFPDRILVSHILIDTSAENIRRKVIDADKDAKLSNAQIDEKVKQEVQKQKDLLNKALKEARLNPKNFAQVAAKYSQDEASAKNGGNLGFVARGQLVPEFEKVAFDELKPGVVSDPVKTQFGEHIILVTDKAKGGIQPYSKVKEDLKKFLDQQNKIAALQKFATGLKDKSKIEFVDEDLNPVNIHQQIDEAFKRQIESSNKKETKPLSKLLDNKKEDKK